ncbi:hydrogenase expression/formation protein HypE [Mesorhizobium sp. M1E.F.Ca.ET.045.02.1.1]|uniref:hydrogenase expression/formation protein HypE n=1 Tax=Mesorhizobium sp. M1E.F.Ca.ET.045.02.1.1 TaxID=2493672 RepID=UPI000F74EC99|nr:hydrogenase expression/formation protein HypE [Mesorhizobium sp. M1E.F.Ca.ET.045.02.1.1]AZO25510.1 hydrogenase expression/formation protein HypE [Mesorhizobium sp. M1E.F.Ca.ET.045.02.1.1]
MTAADLRLAANASNARGSVDMTHGAGGRAMADLIRDVFHKHLANDYLAQGNDGALLGSVSGRLVMAADSHVISPLFFPGGDIGALSVHGTVNDVAMMGARPLWLSASFIIEEGFPLADLERIVVSMALAARQAGVPVVTGDTKVVEKGKGDGVFISTTGVGVLSEATDIGGGNARPGDAIIVSGTMGDHGIAILSKREHLDFETEILSDTQPLNDLVAAMLAAVPGIRVLRDPTRGGLSATLNEIAHQSKVGMVIRETAVPVNPEVAAACELLGLDPLNVANEGKLIAICGADDAATLLAAMRSHPKGLDAALIGEVVADEHALVTMRTRLGGMRVVDWIAGEQLPRIC